MLPRTWRLKILNWLGAGYMRIEKDEECYATPVGLNDCSQSIDVTGLSFSVMPAQGGVILQSRKYDDKNNRNNYSTHIIAEGKDVAEEVGKIVAMELWKV